MTMTETPVTLRLSGDRKVSPLIRRQGSKDAPRVSNSFGLPAGVSCPGKTPFCDSCYAATTERVFTSAARLVYGNYDALQTLGGNVDRLELALQAMVDEFLVQCAKTGASPVFRIHWDGDFYSRPYARAWRRVIDATPQVQYWAYTRTFDVVGILESADNLALYLSVDQYNVRRAATVLRKYPRVHAAYCAETQADCQILADKLERKGAPCPENIGRIPLVCAMSGRRTDTVNVGDDAQGACVACGLCVYGRRDVSFSTTHK